MIFETHAHYDDSRFDDDREELLKKVHDSGVSPIINVGASIESTGTTLELAKTHDYIYAAVGVHPSDISGLNEDSFEWLREQTDYAKTVPPGLLPHFPKPWQHCSLRPSWQEYRLHHLLSWLQCVPSVAML